jgi:hypothetical protein
LRRQWRQLGQTVYGAQQWIQGRQTCEAATREALGDARFAQERSAGAALDLDQAISYPLEGGPPTSEP